MAVVILDITGSMGSQIEGLKRCLRELMSLIAENPTMGIAIITYTERSKGCKAEPTGCYVSLNSFGDAAEASAFVDTIKLCQPPHAHAVSASGEDGPENVLAAMYMLTELHGSKPTLAFVITDAGYHHAPPSGTTDRNERQWLADRGVANVDFYQVLDTVIAHFGGGLVLLPIIYNYTGQDRKDIQAYGQMAHATGSVVMQPISFQSTVLAQAMGGFLKRLLGELNNDVTDESLSESTYRSIHIYDMSGFTPVASESEAVTRHTPTAGDTKKLLETAMTRGRTIACAVTAFRVGWKRRVSVSALSLLRQLSFGLTAARYYSALSAGSSSTEALMAQLEELHPRMLESLPEEQRGQIKATPTRLADMASALVTEEAAAGEGTADMVTLETVAEVLECMLQKWEGDEELEEKDRAFDPVALVCSMVHGRLINIHFPKGPDSKPNYSDAWSAMVDGISYDVLSAETAMKLFQGQSHDGSTTEATGLTDKRMYNGFMFLMDPEDPAGTFVLRAFSGTQVMNVLQMTFFDGSPGGFLPHMYPGTVAAALSRAIKSSSTEGSLGSGTEASNKLIGQMIYSLQNIMGRPAKAARERLCEGFADPANSISKFLLLLCQMDRLQTRWPQPLIFHCLSLQVLDEWLAAIIQLYFGKPGRDSDERHLDFVAEMAPLEVLFGPTVHSVNALEMLHPLERYLKGDVSCMVGASTWEELALAKLKETELFHGLEKLVERVKTVFKCPDLEYPTAPTALELVLYRVRTARIKSLKNPRPNPNNPARYDSTVVEDGSSKTPAVVHAPKVMEPAVAYLVKAHKSATATELAGFAEARRTHCLSVMVKSVASTRLLSETNTKTELLGITYSLSRNDVPLVLEKSGYDDLKFVEELVCGLWAPEPAQCLRRYRATILEAITDAEVSKRIQEAISAQAICMRAVPNRHGHTRDLIYPGPMGWTQEYDDGRCANLGRPHRILPKMKEFTEYGMAALERARAEGDVSTFAAVNIALNQWQDPNCLSKAKELVEDRLLGAGPTSKSKAG
ncbi:unnamed protein product [Chrysoparadoxa australica]